MLSLNSERGLLFSVHGGDYDILYSVRRVGLPQAGCYMAEDTDCTKVLLGSLAASEVLERLSKMIQQN